MNKIIIILVVLVLLVSCGGTKEKSEKKVAEVLSLEVTKESIKVEYGSNFDYHPCVKSGNYDLVSASEINTFFVGKQELVLTAYLKGKSIQKSIEVEVVDTQYPEFLQKIEKIEVQQGKPILLNQFVSTDPIDGRLAVFLSQKIDTNVAGDYEVEVLSSDKHGNTSSTPLLVKVIGQNKTKPTLPETASTNQEQPEEQEVVQPVNPEPTPEPTPEPYIPSPTPEPSPPPKPTSDFIPEGKDFLFADGYDINSAYQACSSYLSDMLSRGYVGTAECMPMENSNQIYIGYKAIFY